MSFRLKSQKKKTKLGIFQFKIIHNILAHGYWLYQMKILDSPLCLFCGENETLMHMLVSCPDVLFFFFIKVLRWWNANTHSKYRVDKVLGEVSIMYGYDLHDHIYLLFNYVLLIAKWHVYVRKLDNR